MHVKELQAQRKHQVTTVSPESIYISGAKLSNPLLPMLGYVAPHCTFLPHTQQSQDMNSKIAPEQ